MNWEAAAVVVAVGLAVLGAFSGIYAILMAHGGKLSEIVAKLVGLEKRDDENREDHGRIFERLDDHEQRLTRLER